MRRVMVVSAVVLVVAVAAGVLRTCTTADREAAPPSSTPAVAPDEVRPATGLRTERLGVPIGWSRDATGARSAAVSAVSLTGELARAGFITRSDKIRVLASRRYGPTLADLSAAQLDAFIDDLAGEGLTSAQLLLQELPLTALVESASADTATVQVWALLVAGGERLGSPRQLWRTVTVELVWEDGDWKVDGWTVRPGPTPALATNAPVASLAELREVTAWPSVGGA
jgi:hypothetical protein